VSVGIAVAEKYRSKRGVGHSMDYNNKASSVSQALIIYLLDISGSMSLKMDNGKLRIEVVTDCLREICKQMASLSLSGDVVRSKYRVAILGYSDQVWDLLGGIKTIDEWVGMGVPTVAPLDRTNTRGAFEAALAMLQEDLNNWSGDEQLDCPAPLVVHLTDGEYTKSYGDPSDVVASIRKMSVPDGNVLVENIYIGDGLGVRPEEIQGWRGFKQGASLPNEYLNKLLQMSSPMPGIYVESLRKYEYKLDDGVSMLFPGVSAEFVKLGFVASIGTGVMIVRRQQRSASQGGKGVGAESE
jgi:hypothetical protein